MPAKTISKGLSPSVQYVLNRLVTDSTFRKRFESNRNAALKGIDLTQSQRSALSKIDVQILTNSVSNLKDIAAAAIGSIYI